ncbi:MAG: hypothetical protein R6X19_10390 [Kiritimatiellia bacterium]
MDVISEADPQNKKINSFDVACGFGKLDCIFPGKRVFFRKKKTGVFVTLFDPAVLLSGGRQGRGVFYAV